MAYLPVRVEGGEGGIQHAAPHVGVAVVQRVRDKEEEEWRDLGFVQVLGQLVQRQGDATPEQRGWVSVVPSSRTWQQLRGSIHCI